MVDSVVVDSVEGDSEVEDSAEVGSVEGDSGVVDSVIFFVNKSF